MGSGSGPTWLTLIDDKRSLFIGHGCNVPANPDSEACFRHVFEDVCKEHREKESTRLSAKLFPSYCNIIEVATAIDASAQDLPRHALVALVWWASCATIKCGSKAGAKPKDLVKLLAELNKNVPKFNANVALHLEHGKVQKVLQEFLGKYVDSYIFLVSYFRKTPPPSTCDPSLDPILEKHILDTTSSLEESRGMVHIMVDQAAQEKEDDRVRSEQPRIKAQLSFCNDSTQPSAVQAQFISMRRLGGGTFGEVDEVRETSTGASYARKHIYPRPNTSMEQLEHSVRNEVKVMQRLRHMHIATVLFYVKEPKAYSILMLPVADSDLLVYLNKCTENEFKVSFVKQIYPWFGCLLDALAYAHKLKIKHRDIKPANILIKNGQPYLTDFGLAKDFTEQDMSASGTDIVQGTPLYRATEIKPGVERARPADVFALGCVFSEMFSITQGKSLQEFRDWRKTATGSVDFRDSLPKVQAWLSLFETNKFNELLADEIKNMVHENPEGRPEAEKSVCNLKHERKFFCLE